MPRRPTVARKEKYVAHLVGTALTIDQLTNKLMRGGKRALAGRILENALTRDSSRPPAAPGSRSWSRRSATRCRSSK